MARPLVSRATGYRLDVESETFVVTYPLRASDGHHGWSAARGDGNDNLIVADPIGTREQKTWTHEGSHNFRAHNLQQTEQGVRRLTPLECERLQGFPDGWTERTGAGVLIADAHRYRMLGNAVATTVAQWLGHRLVWMDSH
jgi:site-specific DNA-cytosine methylase